MRNKFPFIILLILFVSCSQESGKYYIGKNSRLLGLMGTDYILAEKKGDSLQIWYITDDINAGYFERFENETLSYQTVKGKHFEIKEITNEKIVGTDMTLKRVADTKNYFKLRNEVAANIIESQFNDSIKSILQVKYETIVFTHKICDNTIRSDFVSNTHFPESTDNTCNPI